MAIHGFGLRLAALRKRRNLSQRRLSQMLDCSDTRVKEWERGIVFPSFVFLHRMRRALCCDWTALLGE